MISTNTAQFSTRQEVARRYCRVVAAIDDEIFEPVPGETFHKITDLFEGLRRSCSDQGVLCHLHHYPKVTYGPRDEGIVEDDFSGSASAKTHFQRALKVAESADAVILDWNLGTNSPLHSEEILRQLASNSSVRFVFIYTDESANKVQRALKDFFPTIQELLPPPKAGSKEDEEEEEEAVPARAIPAAAAPGEPAPAEKSLGFRLDNQLFIFVGTKALLNAQDVIDEVFRALTRCFPDHIKWAGLEMAAQIRELLPQIVANLPGETDNALLLQLLYQGKDEVAEQIGEALVDELKAALRDSPLKTVSDSTLISHLREVMANLADPSKEAELDAVTKGLGSDFVEQRQRIQKKKTAGERLENDEQNILSFQTRWKTADLSVIRKKVKNSKVDIWFPHKTLEGGSQRQKDLDICQAIGCYLGRCTREDEAMLRPSVAWATVRESVLLPVKNPTMRPGTILRKTAGTANDPEWVLCLTGACDCYRNKHGFLVTAGAIRDSGREPSSSLRQTQTAFLLHEITWDSSRLLVLLQEKIRPPGEETEVGLVVAEPAGPGGLATPNTIDQIATESISEDARYEIAGYLRNEFSARLIHRVWTYQTRPGVDSSELLRQRRAE